MSLKNNLKAMVFATAALAGGAQAQSTPVNTVTRNTTTLANDAIEQNKSDPKFGKQLIVSNLRYSEKFGDTTLGASGQYDEKFGAGISTEALYGNDSVAIGGLYKKLQYAQYSMIGLSKSFGSFNITSTHSTGTQSAQKAIGRTDIEGDLSGNKTTLALTVQEYGILQNFGLKLTHAKTNETTLRNDSVITTEISTQDLAQMIETISRTYDNKTRTYWTGGTTKEASLVAGMRINKQNTLDVSVGKQVMDVLQNRTSSTVGSIGYTYLPTSDIRFKAHINSSGQSRQTGVEFSHVFDNRQGEFIVGYNHNTYNNGIPSSNAIFTGFRYALGGKIAGYSASSSTGPRDARENLRYAMNPINFADPQAIGHVDITHTKVLIKEVTTYAPKEILTTFGKVTINPNGTVTVEFGTNTSGTKKPLQATPHAASNVPNANITYALKIKKPDGTTEIISITPPSWTSPVFESGNYGLTILTTNTVDGKKTETQSEEYKVSIEKDSKEEIGELELIKADYETVLLKYSATDADGIRNENWKIDNNNTAILNVDKNAKTLLIKGATPGSKITLVFEGEYAVKGPDGKLTWKPFKKTKEVSLLIATDSPTILIKPEVSVTYNSISAKNMITDPNGISGQYGELYDASGVLVGSRQNGLTYSWQGLKDGTNYTVKTFAYAIKLLPNNTQESVLVDSNKEAMTNVAGVDAPTAIVLSANNITTNSVLAACNITDLDGATGTCTLTGGPGATSWSIGADKPLTGLVPNTLYTITVTGTKQVKNPDNSLSTVNVNQSVNFTTDLVIPTVSFGSAVTATVGDAQFTRTLTTNSAGTITYSSSNTAVVTVNATTGQVTIVGAGSATITANQVANGAYSAASANYSINVNPADAMPTGPALSDLTMNDEDAINYNAGGVTDPQGRTITYSASGLPIGYTINSSTGLITGNTDVFGDQVLTITVTATAAGGSNPLIRTFTLRILDTY